MLSWFKQKRRVTLHTARTELKELVTIPEAQTKLINNPDMFIKARFWVLDKNNFVSGRIIWNGGRFAFFADRRTYKEALIQVPFLEPLLNITSTNLN